MTIIRTTLKQTSFNENQKIRWNDPNWNTDIFFTKKSKGGGDENNSDTVKMTFPDTKISIIMRQPDTQM
jgi:hypothetical protein